MILVIGGSCQGKLAFAEALLKEKEKGGVLRIADGRRDTPNAAMDADIIYHMELYIRRLLEEKKNPEEFVKRLLLENDGAVVIADEIGSGIVPVDAFEREYRERDGQICQGLAAASSPVYRVLCGIGVKIKN